MWHEFFHHLSVFNSIKKYLSDFSCLFQTLLLEQTAFDVGYYSGFGFKNVQNPELMGMT